MIDCSVTHVSSPPAHAIREKIHFLESMPTLSNQDHTEVEVESRILLFAALTGDFCPIFVWWGRAEGGDCVKMVTAALKWTVWVIITVNLLFLFQINLAQFGLVTSCDSVNWQCGLRPAAPTQQKFKNFARCLYVCQSMDQLFNVKWKS